MVRHSLKVQAAFLAKLGDVYAQDIQAAERRRDDQYVYLDETHEAFGRWHTFRRREDAGLQSRPSEVEPTLCQHRGDVVGSAQCSTCAGSVKAKVYACTVHGRCALFRKPLDGIQACAGCPDRLPPANGIDPNGD